MQTEIPTAAPTRERFAARPVAEGRDKAGRRRRIGREEAFARLMYVVEYRLNSAALAGPAGSGKTALLRRVADRSARTQRQTVFLDSAASTVNQLANRLAEQLHFWPQPAAGFDGLWRQIGDELQGRQHAGIETVFLIDDADRSAGVLELLRRLACLQSGLPDSGVTLIVAGQSATKLRRSLPLKPILNIELEASAN